LAEVYTNNYTNKKYTLNKNEHCIQISFQQLTKWFILYWLLVTNVSSFSCCICLSVAQVLCTSSRVSSSTVADPGVGEAAPTLD